jgi:hypothetical protein
MMIISLYLFMVFIPISFIYLKEALNRIHLEEGCTLMLVSLSQLMSLESIFVLFYFIFMYYLSKELCN